MNTLNTTQMTREELLARVEIIERKLRRLPVCKEDRPPMIWFLRGGKCSPR